MRYFIESLNHIYDLEQKIKKGETENIFQVVILNAAHIKRFTWNLLKLDINFERKSIGSGITIFYIDKKVAFFVGEKK